MYTLQENRYPTLPQRHRYTTLWKTNVRKLAKIVNQHNLSPHFVAQKWNFNEHFQTLQVYAVRVTISITFGVQNVHLSPAHKLKPIAPLVMRSLPSTAAMFALIDVRVLRCFVWHRLFDILANSLLGPTGVNKSLAFARWQKRAALTLGPVTLSSFLCYCLPNYVYVYESNQYQFLIRCCCITREGLRSAETTNYATPRLRSKFGERATCVLACWPRCLEPASTSSNNPQCSNTSTF